MQIGLQVAFRASSGLSSFGFRAAWMRSGRRFVEGQRGKSGAALAVQTCFAQWLLFARREQVPAPRGGDEERRREWTPGCVCFLGFSSV